MPSMIHCPVMGADSCAKAMVVKQTTATPATMQARFVMALLLVRVVRQNVELFQLDDLFQAQVVEAVLASALHEIGRDTVNRGGQRFVERECVEAEVLEAAQKLRCHPVNLQREDFIGIERAKSQLLNFCDSRGLDAVNSERHQLLEVEIETEGFETACELGRHIVDFHGNELVELGLANSEAFHLAG